MSTRSTESAVEVTNVSQQVASEQDVRRSDPSFGLDQILAREAAAARLQSMVTSNLLETAR